MRKLWIAGAGGHAKVVIDAARASGLYEVTGALDDDPRRTGGNVLGVPVRGAISAASVSAWDIEWLVLAIGDNRRRWDLAARLDGRVRWATVVHPSAVVADSAVVAEGTVVCARAVVQAEARIGRHVILNTGCTIDHDGMVEDFAHVAPGASVAGGVTVGEGVLLGIGACVVPGRRLGAWATAGAGAAVVADVEAGATVRGVPARATSA